MGTIDIFYQGEGLREIEHLETDERGTFGELKKILASKHGLGSEVLIFLEDTEEPVGDEVELAACVQRTGIKAHLHRCRKIEITVNFNGKAVERKFSPGTTVARVKHWAAVERFGMTPEEAGEHVLQISGSQTRPAPGTHIGTLTSPPPACRLAFDLVPDQRVNGSSAEDWRDECAG
jgi:hypothetical protein